MGWPRGHPANTMRTFLPFFLIVAVVYWVSSRNASERQAASDSEAPAWQFPNLRKLEITDLGGQPMTISPGDGRIWVLGIGAGWVKDSEASMRLLAEVSVERPDLRVLAVLADSRIEDSRAFAQRLKLPLQVVWADEAYVATYGLPGSLPRWMVIGRDGRPAGSLLPGAPKAELLSALDKALAVETQK